MTSNKKNSLSPGAKNLRRALYRDGWLPTVEQKEALYSAITLQHAWYTRKAHSNWCKAQDRRIIRRIQLAQQHAYFAQHVGAVVHQRMLLLPDPPLTTLREWAAELGVMLSTVATVAAMVQEQTYP